MRRIWRNQESRRGGWCQTCQREILRGSPDVVVQIEDGGGKKYLSYCSESCLPEPDRQALRDTDQTIPRRGEPPPRDPPSRDSGEVIHCPHCRARIGLVLR